MTEEQKSHDIILIGAGHQGLIAASYLAKNGYRVAIYEAESPHISSHPYAPFYEDTYTGPCAHLPVNVSNLVVSDLNLAEYGWKMDKTSGQILSFGLDGKILNLFGDKEATEHSIKNLYGNDAPTFFRLNENLIRLANAMEQIAREVPHYTKDGWKDLWGIFETGKYLSQMPQEHQKLFSKLMKTSLIEFLEDQFESPLLRAEIALQTCLFSAVNPQKAGSAVSLLEYILSVGSDTQLFMSDWQPLRGSLHTYISALRDSAATNGVRFETDALAKEIQFDDAGKVIGIETTNGFVKSQAVLTDISPALLFQKMVEPKNLSVGVRSRFGQGEEKTKNLFAQIKFALKKLPEFEDLKLDNTEEALTGEIHLCPDTDVLKRSYETSKLNQTPDKLALSMILPSIASPDLRSGQFYPCSVIAQYVSHDALATDDARKQFGETVTNIIDSYAPGFKDSVAHAHVLSREATHYGIGGLNRDLTDSGLPILRLFNARFDHHALQAKHDIEDLFICGFGIEGSAAPQLLNNGYVVAQAIMKIYDPQN